MGYIFYDTETSGLSDEFDQIFQFSAIHTDEDLNIIDVIDLRGRRMPQVVPAPGALKVTRVWPEQIEKAPLSHLELVEEVRKWIEARSPATIVGFNSIDFDEEFLRQAFYKSLMPLYLTNTNGNQRGDIMRVAMATCLLDPGAIEIPVKITSKGEQCVFKLGDLATANKLGMDLANAHDALFDVKMTIALAKRLKEKSPAVWDRMRLNQSKADVMEFLEQTPLFTYGDFYFGKDYQWFVAPLGVNPVRETEFAVFDVLGFDPAKYLDRTEEQLADILSRNPKPIRIIHTNWQPIVAKPSMHPRWNGKGLDHGQDALTDEQKKLMEERARLLQANPQFLWKVQKALQIRAERSDAVYAAEAEPSPERPEDAAVPVNAERRDVSAKTFEQLIYGGFPSKEDDGLMQKFHQGTWQERAGMLGKFADDRLNQIAALLVYDGSPESLPAEKRNAIAGWVHARVTRTEPDTEDNEALARRFLSASWEEKVDMVGKFGGGDGNISFDFINQVAALVALAEAPEDAPEEKLQRIEAWTGIERGDKLYARIKEYKKRYIGNYKDRRDLKCPKSKISYLTVGKAFLEALFCKYDGCNDIRNHVETMKKESQPRPAQVEKLRKMKALWQEGQPHIAAIVAYLERIAQPPVPACDIPAPVLEKVDPAVSFVGRLSEIPGDVLDGLKDHLPEPAQPGAAQAEIRIPLKALFNAVAAAQPKPEVRVVAPPAPEAPVVPPPIPEAKVVPEPEEFRRPRQNRVEEPRRPAPRPPMPDYLL